MVTATSPTLTLPRRERGLTFLQPERKNLTEYTLSHRGRAGVGERAEETR